MTYAIHAFNGLKDAFQLSDIAQSPLQRGGHVGQTPAGTSGIIVQNADLMPFLKKPPTEGIADKAGTTCY
jgi:hypothetical protein